MSQQRGFTLIEIILALSVLAVIGVMLVNILSLQIQLRSRVSEADTNMHTLHAALNRVVSDLAGAYLPAQANATVLNVSRRPVAPYFRFKKDQLILFTMAQPIGLANTNQSNQAFVRYDLKPYRAGDQNDYSLTRTWDGDFVRNIENDGVGASQVLVEHVSSFSLLFWDGNTFRKEWDSTSNDTTSFLPKLVKIELALYRHKSENKSSLQDTVSLQTIVFLPGTRGQPEANEPKWTEYKWQ